MSNPWLMKNPWMSLWLSGANRMAGSMRGLVAAQVQRQANAAATEATYENVLAPSTALALPTPKKRSTPKAEPKAKARSKSKPKASAKSKSKPKAKKRAR